MELKDLEGKEAEKAIKDSETMMFDDFVKKYKTSQWATEVVKIIDSLKEKVKE